MQFDECNVMNWWIQFANAMQILQCDEWNEMNVMWWMHCDECNVANAIWEVQWDELNVMIALNEYNVMNAM